MMIRVRSSSRCSTSESRSSCPMGFSRVAMALRRGDARRARLSERSRMTSPSTRRRPRRSGRPERGRRLGASVVVVVLRVGLRVTESLNSRMPVAELAAERGQPAAADDHEHDQQDDEPARAGRRLR